MSLGSQMAVFWIVVAGLLVGRVVLHDAIAPGHPAPALQVLSGHGLAGG